MKKRVLHLTGSFHNGGSERQAVGLATALKDAGKYEVRLGTLNRTGVLLDDVRSAGFDDIPEFPLTSFFNVGFVKQVRRCASFLRKNSIDVIHTHDFYTNVFGMAAACVARTPVRIASKRETGGMRTKAQDVIENAAFGRADRIVANSEAVRRSLAERGIAEDKIAVIYNGLDLDRFVSTAQIKPELNPELDIPPRSRNITLVANLRHDVKNVPMFLRAAKRVSASEPDTHFIIAGEGGLEGALRSLAFDLGLEDKVHFVGRCDDVPALLASSFACVLTSRAEGFANSIIEYMGAGKPVIATDVGGAKEAILDGETGYLVASDDADDMASKLLLLLNDAERATAFGNAAREVARSRFSRMAQVEKTAALYDSLLAA